MTPLKTTSIAKYFHLFQFSLLTVWRESVDWDSWIHMQWHVLQAFQNPHFHLHLTTYDNLSIFDPYYEN